MELKREFKIGDKVRVINSGNVYDSFLSWFEQFEPQYASVFKQSKGYYTMYANGAEGTVIAVHKHPNQNNILCAVKNNGRIFLISQQGLEMVSPKKVTKETQDFKVGDIVVSKGSNPYGITDKSMITGKVTELYSPASIRVMVLDHKRPVYIGDDFIVQKKYFVLKEEQKTTPVKEEKEVVFKVEDRVNYPRWGNGKIIGFINAESALVMFEKTRGLHDGNDEDAKGYSQKERADRCWYCSTKDLTKLEEPKPVVKKIKPREFEVFDRIIHSRFGKGTIIKTNVDKMDLVLVLFDTQNTSLHSSSPDHTKGYTKAEVYKRCWYSLPSNIKLMEDQTIPKKSVSLRTTSDGRVRISKKAYESICTEIDSIRKECALTKVRLSLAVIEKKIGRY